MNNHNNQTFYKIFLVSALLLFFISGSFAESVETNISYEYWKVINQSYISENIDFTIQKINDVTYLVNWEWNDLTIKEEIYNCANAPISEQTQCSIDLRDSYFPLYPFGQIRSDIALLSTNGMPLTKQTANFNLSATTLTTDSNSGSFYIYLNPNSQKGETLKIGFETTIIELTDVNVNITIDPETEECQDGLCIHNIIIDNNTDGSFCFNSLDI